MARNPLLIAALAGLAAAAAPADTISWNNPVGGLFNASANWDPAQIPGAADVAAFGLGGGTYNVTFFAFNRTNQRLRVSSDTVNMNLLGSTYTLSSTTGDSISLGGAQVQFPGLPVANGRLNLSSGTTLGSINAQSVAIGGAGLFGSGALTVGANVLLNSAGILAVGRGVGGTLRVEGGGDITGFMGVVGEGRAGTATVAGAGSSWINSASLDVAAGAAGTLNVEAGGLVRSQDAMLAIPAGITGTVNITGSGSRWQSNTTLTLGAAGNAVLNISAGGLVQAGAAGTECPMAAATGSTAQVTVSGAASRLIYTNSPTVQVGRMGAATLRLQDGGFYSNSGNTYVGWHPSGSGTVIVTGAGSRFQAFGGIAVGGSNSAPGGIGSFTVDQGGEAETSPGSALTIWPSGAVNLATGGTLRIGNLLNHGGAFNWSGGTLQWLNRFFVAPTGPFGGAVSVGPGRNLIGAGIEVNGPEGTRLTASGNVDSPYDLVIGRTATGLVSMSSSADLSCATLVLGEAGAARGTLSLDGAGVSALIGQFGLTIPHQIGAAGQGTMSITGSATATVAYANFDIGALPGSTGSLTVSGAGSQFSDSVYGTTVGFAGNGSLSILAGAHAAATPHVAEQIGSSGQVIVGGQGSQLNAGAGGAGAIIGSSGNATMTVSDGGAVSLGDIYVADRVESTSSVTVTGVASSINLSPGAGAYGHFVVGGAGNGTLRIEAGAHASGDEAFIADGSGSQGTLIISGAGSELTTANQLAVGYGGAGTATISSGGRATAGTLRIGTNPGSSGTATVQGLGSRITAGGLLMGNGTQSLLTIADGGVVQISGTASIINGARVNLSGGTLAAAIASINAGTLQGHGSVSGNLSNLGTVAPGTGVVPGQISVQGPYNQNSFGTLAVGLGGPGPGQHDRMQTSGNAQLAGTLNSSFLGGYEPHPGDVYTILTAASITGTFDTVNLPPVSAGSIHLRYSPTSVRIVYCYPNCDGSTAAPVLNVGDFTCFLQAYAAGSTYANCDISTATPVLNVGDFTCFLQSYAAGCQ